MDEFLEAFWAACKWTFGIVLFLVYGLAVTAAVTFPYPLWLKIIAVIVLIFIGIFCLIFVLLKNGIH